MYLKDHPAFIGQIKSHRFIYQVESWRPDPITGINQRIVEKAERNTSCVALDYKIIETMGVDLERVKVPDQTSMDLNQTDNLPKPKSSQNELPFWKHM